MYQAFGSSPLENVVQLSSGEFSGDVLLNRLIMDHLATVIIFQRSFFIFDQRRHLQDQQESAPSFDVALEQYMASPCAAAVMEAVSAAIHGYEEAVSTASRTYE